MNLEDNISYKSISQESDAFIFSDNFLPYIELEINGIFNSEDLDFNKYTAGTTDNPEDYKLPDISNFVLPNKLIRINAFNKNNKELIIVSNSNVENSVVLDFDSSFMSEDALQFAKFFNNKDTKVKRKQSSNKSIFISESDESFEEITLKQRFFSHETAKAIDEAYSVNIEKEPKNVSDSKDSITEIKSSSTINNNKYEYKTIKDGSRIINNDQNFSYDIYSEQSNSFYDFTSKVEQNTFLTEMKNDLISNFEQKITNLETKVVNNNITKQEINQFQNNIVQVIETKLKQSEEQIIEKIEQKSDEKLKKFRNNFLNS